MMTKVGPNRSEILSDRARRADPPIRLTRGHEKKIGVAVLLSFEMLLASIWQLHGCRKLK